MSHPGPASRRATTTAVVTERPLDEDGVLRVVLDGLVAASLVDPTSRRARQDGRWLAYALTADLLELAELTPVGTVIARDGDRFLIRATPGPVPSSARGHHAACAGRDEPVDIPARTCGFPVTFL